MIGENAYSHLQIFFRWTESEKKIKESCKEQSKQGERNNIYFQLIS